MKKLLIISLSLFFATLGYAQDQIAGKWNTADNQGKVEIYKSKATYSGKILSLKNGKNADGTDKTDKKNPDKSLRNKPIKGLVIVTGLQYKDGKWINGKVYDPESGRTYNCEVRLEDGKLKLKGKWGPFSRTQTWTRSK